MLAHRALVLIAAIAGCGKGTGSAPAAPGTSCTQVIACVGACGDEACKDACIERGTVAARTTASALAECMVKQACDGQDCIATRCGPELTACTTDLATAAPPPPTASTLVGSLTGKWLGRGTVFTTYKFEADGKVTRWLRIGTTGLSGHTTYQDSLKEVGTATQDGDVLVLTWNAQTFSSGSLVERYRVDWIDFIEYKHTPQLTAIDCPPAGGGCTTLLTTVAE